MTLEMIKTLSMSSEMVQLFTVVFEDQLNSTDDQQTEIVHHEAIMLHVSPSLWQQLAAGNQNFLPR